MGFRYRLWLCIKALAWVHIITVVFCLISKYEHIKIELSYHHQDLENNLNEITLKRYGRNGTWFLLTNLLDISFSFSSRLAQHSTPEILRTPLQDLALNIKLLKLGKIAEFLNKALEPPPLDAVVESIVLLKEMEALDENEALTSLGYILAKLPIEPRLGKMIILGCAFQ